MNEQRNLVLAMLLSIIVLTLYWFFVSGPKAREAELAQKKAALTQEQNGEAGLETLQIDSPILIREEALKTSKRIQIKTPSLTGSLSLKGARFDDIQLVKYHETTAKDSPLVTLLSPENAPQAYYIINGYMGLKNNSSGLPDSNTDWQIIEGKTLTPHTPITLYYQTPDQRLAFTRHLTVDKDYLFTVEDKVHNLSETEQILSRYAGVKRDGLPDTLTNFMILHEGPISVVNHQLHDKKYKKFKKKPVSEMEGQSGWIGQTDKYWLVAAIPEQNQNIKVKFSAQGVGEKEKLSYNASYIADPIRLKPGEFKEIKTFVFAGAKKNSILTAYQKNPGISQLNLAIDWGYFWFLTKPFSFALELIGSRVGNYGIAILIFTLIVKLIFFPLANKSYEMTAKMKRLQPKIQTLRARHKNDSVKLQQEIMALYKREKVTPISGCLPMLLQIPVFFALYKVLFITIDMRQAPFFGWIKDLSAPDPTSFFNLFGLLPWDPSTVPLIGASILSIGAWPLIMGLTMAAQQAISPPAVDPKQQYIFAFMPVIFTIILAPFAAGLVIYWAWNNLLTILQQWVIYKRLKVDTPIDSFIKKLRHKITNKNESSSED